MKQIVALSATVLALSMLDAIPSGFAAGPIKITVVSGEGSLNNIAKKRAQSPVIKVTDLDDTPITGAEVTFTLPPSGPSGTFTSGKREYRTRTNEQGEAEAEAFQPNRVEGRFFITVSAVQGDSAATRKIPQTNTTAGGILE